uniref:Uncharacterized protein n=1 Tax=Homalodisca liturata TaxID=320908 RepID=A0A1B6K7D5_9HEMI
MERLVNSVLQGILIVCYLTFVFQTQETVTYTNNELQELCNFINKTDFKIKNIYHTLPKRRGDKLLRYMNIYNEAFSKLTKYVVMNHSITVGECQNILKPGASRWFYALYDDELLKYYFKWTPPYTKNKGKYEEMLDYRVAALGMWNQLHEFFGLEYFDFYKNMLF